MNSKRASVHPDTVPESVVQLYLHARKKLLLNRPFDRGLGSSDSPLSEAEYAVLERVGLTAEYPQGRAADPRDQSIADYMALLETSLTTGETAKALRVDPSRVRQRIRELSLYAVDYEGEKRLPRFQFHGRQVLPGLRNVLSALPRELNPLDVTQWFLAANVDLEIDSEDLPLSPRDWLLRGQPVVRVVELARQFE